MLLKKAKKANITVRERIVEHRLFIILQWSWILRWQNHLHCLPLVFKRLGLFVLTIMDRIYLCYMYLFLTKLLLTTWPPLSYSKFVFWPPTYSEHIPPYPSRCIQTYPKIEKIKKYIWKLIRRIRHVSGPIGAYSYWTLVQQHFFLIKKWKHFLTIHA